MLELSTFTNHVSNINIILNLGSATDLEYVELEIDDIS
jgi:hypothetical protein